MLLNDIDPQFIKAISCLYASDNIQKGEPVRLQNYLEEAIKNKFEVTKDLSNVVFSSMKQRRIEEFKTFINPVEESKCSSSDNELELDLFKEDLMCTICNGMDVGARNRLIECTECHMLYHQECHKPIVGLQDSYESWVCQKCKDATKKATKTANSPVSASSSSGVGSSGSQSKLPLSFKSSSTSHRHSSSSSSSSYKSTSKGDKNSKSNSTSTKSNSSGKASSGSSSSRSNVTPNINIISADKRIQIMKKKAAKVQEKRKHLPH